MGKHPLIRTIYLYLFALIGLTLLTIGTVRFVNMGLKAFVFTKANDEEELIRKQFSIPYSVQRIEQETEEKEEICLSEEEKADIEYWLADYKNWKGQWSEIDPVLVKRHRDASLNLSLILVGLPLYLYHWQTIKRETRNKES